MKKTKSTKSTKKELSKGLSRGIMKKGEVKKQLSAVRNVQIEQGAYDGRFSPKKYDDKKKKVKNGYKKYKNEREQ